MKKPFKQDIGIIIIILLSVFFFKKCEAQNYKFELEKELPSAICAFIAGGFEGVQDGLAFHNKSNHPFWGQNSWLNKYKNHDPAQGKTFRGKYLIFTTDGFHAAKFANHLFAMGAIALHVTNGKRKWYVIVLETLSYWAINRLSFTLIYNRF